MVTIQPITAAHIAVYKTVRLRALLDTPSAFGSTYAQESAMSDADWAQRVARCDGDRAAGFLAVEGDEACGLVAVFFDAGLPATAYMVSMWVAPPHRKTGVGKQLVFAVIEWAQTKGAQTLRLMVTSSNETAMRFYDRLGFAMTGVVVPYPNDPNLMEHEMVRTLETRNHSKAI